ncbi:energy transducer TonB [Pedobacter glucosidilyticus]|uniref:energy transducer TonB n=1 Tax=Pedobacter glucosidilyticus TaxID=1122941 RepID=UPI0026EBDF60|nr:TonB family protein [Pedobacter glucosidilyticus]
MILNYLHIILLLLSSFFIADVPTFKGGKVALENFINENMKYPDFSKSHCIEGKIFVKFQLDEQGNVLNPKVEKGLGIDLDDEAIRLIKLTSGKWQNPKAGTSLVIPVSFYLQDFKCENVTSASIKEAINYYKIRKGLESSVINYYKNKDQIKTNKQDDAVMQQLKEELGLEEEILE